MTKPLTMSEEREEEIRAYLLDWKGVPKWAIQNLIAELDATREAKDALEKRLEIANDELDNLDDKYAAFVMSLSGGKASRLYDPDVLEGLLNEHIEGLYEQWEDEELAPIKADLERVTKDRDRLAGENELRLKRLVEIGDALDGLSELCFKSLSDDPPPEPQGAAEAKPRCHVCGAETTRHANFCSFRGDPKDMKVEGPAAPALGRAVGVPNGGGTITSSGLVVDDRPIAITEEDLVVGNAPAPQPGEFGEPASAVQLLPRVELGEWDVGLNKVTLFGFAGRILGSFYDGNLGSAMVARYNALSGIPDPEAFVRAAKARMAAPVATDAIVISGREWAAITDGVRLIQEIVDGKFNDDRDGPSYKLQHIGEVLHDVQAAIRGEGK